MSNQNTSQKHVLLDTNILQYLGKQKSNLSNQLLDYINSLLQQKYILAISSFCIFELLDGCPTKEKEAKLFQTIEALVRFEVSAEVLLTTARLSTLYRNEKAEYAHIQDGDKIIGATALLTESLILTANMRDFPRPFFVEEKITHIIYKEGRRERVLSFYLLKPDIEVILYRFERRP